MSRPTLEKIGFSNCSIDEVGTCTTCSDEAVPVEVINIIDAENVYALLNNVEVEVDTSLVGPVGVGDKLLVHAGVALSHSNASEVQNE